MKTELEEAAEKYIETSHYMDKNRMTDIMFGANWQAERMFSEEDAINFAWYLVENLGQFSDDRDAHFKGKYLAIWKGDKKK